MTRLSVALAGLGFAFVATVASAQSYPQPYAMYPSQMQQAAYGYGPMQSGGMYPMQSAGMYPSLPNGAIYGGGGYPSGAYQAAYSSNMMPPQEMPVQPNQYPAGQQASAGQGSFSQSSGQSQPMPNNEYHGPQGAIAKANPPPMKLPPGVKSENGLLYYNGSPTAPPPDVGYQQFPGNHSSGSPFQMASYQAGAENGTSSGAQPSVMNPGANYGSGMPPGNAATYGGSASQCGDQGGNQCDGCDGCCPWCNWLSAPCRCFYGLCHGSAFPGKLGYVWNIGYDSLAMTRNSGSDRPLLKLDTGTTPLPTIFTADDLNFDWDYGGKVHLELIGPSGITYQLAYTRIATFVTNETVFGSADLSLPGPISALGFADADQASFYYSSAIQTGEANMIFPFGSFEVLAGYRYMQIDEKSQISLLTSGSPSTFLANSLNAMSGGQIGALGRWEMFGLFDFDFDAKFAVMGDEATTNQIASSPAAPPPPTVVGTGEGSKTRVAFVSELGLQAVLPLGASLSAHCGYNVFFIDRVALAPDQFDFNLGSSSSAGTQVNNHGDIVLQGVNVGLTAVW
jgi:hypothetical protein